MYKVFIENKAVEFDCNSDKDLLEKFVDYKYVEAAGGIVGHQNHYLFIHRLGVWDLPKGKLEKHEIPEEGALREIEGECSIKELSIVQHIVNTWHTYTQKDKKYIKKTFWYHVISNEKNPKLKPQLEEGISEAKFFSKEEFELIKSNTYLSIRLVIEEFEKKIE